MSDLDSILDAALDEFDASSAPPTNASASPTTAQPTASTNVSTSTPSPSTDVAAAAAASIAATPSGDNNLTADPASIAAFQAFLQAMSQSDVGQQLLAGQAASSGENMEDMQKELNEMLSQMTEAAKSQTAASPNTSSAPAAAAASAAASNAVAAAPAAATPATASADPFNDAIRMIAEGARSMPAGADGMPDMGSDAQMEALLSKLMAEMGGMGGAGMPGMPGMPGSDGDFDGGSMDAMVEKMMGSMLSKEYLYQPMKDIADRYPEYLETHASEISEADMVNYRKQQDCFQRIVAAFETEPQSSLKIMELMNEMQTYGTPPKELVANFTPPGFDPNQPLPPGMAGLAGLGAGGAAGSAPAYPGLPNMGGDPNAPPTAAEMEAFKKMSDDACKQQ